MTDNRLMSAVVLIMSLVSCSNNKAQTLQNVGGDTALDIYRQAISSRGDRAAKDSATYRVRHMMVPDANLEPYTRNAETELQMTFRKHPNPTIRIFVYPHLSTRDNAPVPGYMTAISLYAKDEYALPSEVLAHQGSR